MHRAITVLVLVLFLAPVAAAQVRVPVTTPLNDIRDMDAEPNVATGGFLPSGHAYPADAHGVAEAKAGNAVPILDAKLMTFCPGLAECAMSNLLASFVGEEFLVYGHKRWAALHGTWADGNGDGVVQDRELEGRAVEGADPATLASSRSYAQPLAPSAAETGDEFTGIGGRQIVGYVTPHLVKISDGSTNTPSFVFAAGDVPGLYYSDSGSQVGGLPTYFDQALLRSTAVEVISDPLAATFGPRDYALSATSLVDVDLYEAVDPTVEALYTTLVPMGHFGVTDATNDVLFGDDDDGLIPTTQRDGLAAFAPQIGPARAAVMGPDENENGQRQDYTEAPHAFFDAWLHLPSSWSALPTAFSHGTDCGSTVSRCHAGVGGEDRPVAMAGYGVFGLWHDLDADGWIGAPATFGCPDAYGCGWTSPPNDHFERTDAGDREFDRYCIAEGGAVRTITMRVQPDTPGARWTDGVYVVRDEDPEDARRDPYDDAVDDALDGNIDRLVAQGAVTLTLRCSQTTSTDVGVYPSDELLVFPVPPAYDVVMTTDPVATDFTDLGILTVEVVSDRDVVRGWTL